MTDDAGDYPVPSRDHNSSRTTVARAWDHPGREGNRSPERQRAGSALTLGARIIFVAGIVASWCRFAPYLRWRQMMDQVPGLRVESRVLLAAVVEAILAD